MRVRRLALLLLLSSEATAQDKQTCWSEDKRFSIEVPASWVVEPTAPRTSALWINAKVPGLSGVVEIDLVAVERTWPTARAQAYSELDAQRKSAKARVARYAAEPVPHIYLEHGDRVTVLTFVRANGRGLHCFFCCKRKDFETLRLAIFAAGASVKSTVGPAPLPEGYRRTEKNGLVYLRADGVRRDALIRVQKTIAFAQKQFAKHHGKIERTADEPAVVYVHPTPDAAPMENARTATHGHYADPYGRRLFTVPLAKDDDASERHLAQSAWDLFYCEYYGGYKPDWARVGGRRLLWLEMKTGRKAPHVTAQHLQKLSEFQTQLNALDTLRDFDWEAYSDHALAYVMYFRLGPAKYRKAYRALLKQVLETSNVDDAFRHMRAFDMGILRDKVAKYMKTRLRVVK